MMKKRIIQKLFAMIIGTIMLAFTVPQTAYATPLSLIDATRSATLRILKSAGDPLSQYGDPNNPDADLSCEPISGIEFQVARVKDVDLSTNEGGQAAEKTAGMAILFWW
ncbi:Uncharacterised protein [Corynebacterium kutscheri]|uniref:Uncharacterized protein n=1 Tax=Corynebacterium kutscheri TaxID=35755 RepID=A0A0F6R2Y4_9CORY|nr:hypothetical protein [Corynebacterium kutscheri]AKE41913.1 hypothetical protein UL82_08830 [Corynebacterium kutscheri]VEH10248.1 Uncharacterised protein [Corynebacterium kutscheri]VEH82389.1 Uncharacterised protein [Corynebacterium kutscheri]